MIVCLHYFILSYHHHKCCALITRFFQDVKDLALFTAPTNILSPTLINMLHTQTVERFIRAMTVYCQYYLQVIFILPLTMSEAVTRFLHDCKEGIFLN